MLVTAMRRRERSSPDTEAFFDPAMIFPLGTDDK
jgi:hypothetical protein